MERWLSAKPSFSTKSPTFDSNLTFTIEATNRTAKKNKPLGVRVRGLNITDATSIKKSNSKPSWIIDLSKIDRINDVLIENNDYEFQFFFDPNNPSEKMTLRYVASTTPAPHSQNNRHTVKWRHAADFVNQISSNLNASLQSDAPIIISRAFPSSGPQIQWRNVHDGKELLVLSIEGLDISGGTILAEPRYAWIVNFIDCHQIALRNVTMGHTDAGYCMGGVVRFENCSDITIESCELFGCGTYGLEFVNCRNIEVVDTVVKECSYGGANLKNVSGVTFRNCTFTRNEGFDLIHLDGTIEDVTFASCTFHNNSGVGYLFSFKGHESQYGFFVIHCSFENNFYSTMITPPHEIDKNFNTIK